MNRHKRIWLLSVSLIFLSCSKASLPIDKNKNGNRPEPRVYYISPEGHDDGKGTIGDPLQSVNAVMPKLAPGDTVLLRGGHYYQQVTITRSGTKEKYITFKAYPGETPVIDGNMLSVSGWQALVTMTDVSNISLEGIDVANFVTGDGGTDPEGIKITGTARNIHINKCRIYNIKNNAPLAKGRSGHAILVLGTGREPITGLEITGCTVHDTQTGTSENITLAGNVDGFKVSGNTLYHTENIGIIVAGGDNLNPKGDPATNFARNGIISDNTLYNISMGNSLDIWGNMYGAIAIYVCGGAGTVIERNTVYNSDRGIGLVSESNLYASRDCIVRNNYVYNCNRTGIYMGDYLNFVGSGTKNCYILNNTLFQNNHMKGAFAETEGEIRLTEHCESNVIMNNLIYGGPGDVFIHKYTGSGKDNTIDYNYYYSPDGGAWNWNHTQDDGNISDFTTWQKVSGHDMHSMFGADPGFKDLQKPDLQLSVQSPVWNAGHLLEDISLFGMTDINGAPRIDNKKISMGAAQIP